MERTPRQRHLDLLADMGYIIIEDEPTDLPTDPTHTRLLDATLCQGPLSPGEMRGQVLNLSSTPIEPLPHALLGNLSDINN